MLAYQFETTIKDGAIKVPDEYPISAFPKVKVLLMPGSERIADKTAVFPDLKLRTKGVKFDREEANER